MRTSTVKYRQAKLLSPRKGGCTVYVEKYYFEYLIKVRYLKLKVRAFKFYY